MRKTVTGFHILHLLKHYNIKHTCDSLQSESYVFTTVSAAFTGGDSSPHHFLCQKPFFTTELEGTLAHCGRLQLAAGGLAA